jgi:hypothetical protein
VAASDPSGRVLPDPNQYNATNQPDVSFHPSSQEKIDVASREQTTFASRTVPAAVQSTLLLVRRFEFPSNKRKRERQQDPSWTRFPMLVVVPRLVARDADYHVQ